MKKVLLDTNIYGLIAIDEKRLQIRRNLADSNLIVYGNPIIRKELRNTKKGFVDGINLRLALLELYHDITKGREVELGKSQSLAKSYYSAYGQIGGSTSFARLMNDFVIVASAALHKLDIVISEDNSTMLNEIAIKAYNVANTAMKLKTPRFIGYEEFKRTINA